NFETNKIDKSKKFLDLALPGSKSDPLIANYLGNYFENKKDFKLAISFYYIANKNEKDIVSIEKIGKIYRKLKYYPEALIWFKKVKEIRPSEMIDYQTAITYFYLRELDFAKFILKKYIKTTTNPVIPALYAKILQMEKKYQETIDYLTKNRLEFDQKNLIIGISYYKLEKSKKAINYLKKYLKSKPDSYAAGMILSKLFISLKSFGKAIGVIEQLIGYHPKKYVINIIYSEALLAQNKIDEAIESYESAIEKTNNKNIKKELKELINELRMKQSNQANAKFVDTPLSSSFSAARTGQRSKRRRIISGDELARINAHLGAKFTKIYDKIIK
ncbi:hypothetical protein KAJ27_25465, partial [bacterium]|nr:hypothetical protein [bacterium]